MTVDSKVSSPSLTWREKYALERAKRLRPDGPSQYVEITGDLEYLTRDPFATNFDREPIETTTEFLIVGGGYAGLMVGARLREAGVGDIRIVERGADFGGTWYWNRYPGARCDIESLIYMPLLEEMGYMPSEKYATGQELFAHAQAIGRRYDLYSGALFQTAIHEIVRDEEANEWIVTTDRHDRIRARYVVLCNGLLDKPKLPGIPGLSEFAGHMFHTCRWDYSYAGGGPEGDLPGLRDKRVAIIGTGATAVQVIPAIAESAAHLFVFQRTPSSIDVRANRPVEASWFKTLEPGWQRQRMHNFTSLISGGQESEDLVGDGWTEIFRELTGSGVKEASARLGRRLTAEEKEALLEAADFQKMEKVRSRVDSVVADPNVADALKPWYRQFCKRPCFHDEYLDTYNRDNVTLVDTGGRGVDSLTARGAVVDDVVYDFDCLIFATGFEVGTPFTQRAGFDVVGVNGLRLSEKWADGLVTLHGMTTHDFPNMFFTGRTQTAGGPNYTHNLDEQTRHLAYIIGEARRAGAERVEVSREAELSWQEEIARYAHRADKFYEDCTPGYFNNEGRPTGSSSGVFADGYGGGPIRFFTILHDWRENGQLEGLDFR
jgi:cation diffusion facilitator CzcD-associated flavoprotein CzcO